MYSVVMEELHIGKSRLRFNAQVCSVTAIKVFSSPHLYIYIYIYIHINVNVNINININIDTHIKY